MDILNPKIGTVYSAFCRNYPRTNGTRARTTLNPQPFDIHKTSDDHFALKYTSGMFIKSQHVIMLSRDTKEIGRLPESFAQETWKHLAAKRGSGTGDLLIAGIQYAVNLAVTKAQGISGCYLHFATKEGVVEQVVLLGNTHLVGQIISSFSNNTSYKTADSLSEELLLIFQNQDTRKLYLNNFDDDRVLRGRYSYTSFISILVITIIVGQRCANRHLPKALAVAHRQMMIRVWGDISSEVRCNKYVISTSERFKLFEILREHIGREISIDAPDHWKTSFETLIRASLLIRMEMYNQELALIQANAPNSIPDVDKVLFAWAMRSHQLMREDGVPNPNINLPQETFRILCLKEAFSVYYNSIIDVLSNQ